MKPFAIFLIINTLLLLQACRNKEKVGYYKTGEIEYRVSVDESGCYEGNVKYYYKSGKIKRLEPFTNCNINGEVIKYYPDGKIYAVEEWSNGIHKGLLKYYYPNGQVKYEGKKLGNFWIDTVYWYYPNGRINHILIYNKSGRKIDFAVYDKNGNKKRSYTTPLLISEKDTIYTGENYLFNITLANRMSNATYVKFFLPKGGVDSLLGNNGRYYYLIRKPKSGQHVIKARVYQKWMRGDTLITDWFGIFHAFYVKDTLVHL